MREENALNDDGPLRKLKNRMAVAGVVGLGIREVRRSTSRHSLPHALAAVYRHLARGASLPVAEGLAGEVLSLPVYQIRAVVTASTEALSQPAAQNFPEPSCQTFLNV